MKKMNLEIKYNERGNNANRMGSQRKSNDSTAGP